MRSLTWLLVVPLAMAAICPMTEHQVCNPSSAEHACSCQLIQADEGPPKEQTCNNMIKRDLETGHFPVVSVVFNLDDSVDNLEEFPEEAFREAIATTLRIEDDDILILRSGCQGTDNALTVQFAVLKKNQDDNETSIPYDEEEFVDAESIATRMKAMGHLSQIADLDVDSIEFTEELIDTEFEPDNSDLLIQVVVVGTAFGLMFLLGLWFGCRNSNDYSDDLQKA